jgi:3-oxoacyl-[acyl-carrier protein] reductase
MSAVRKPSPLEDRVFLVTGATGGIGQTVAEALVAEGARLFLTGRNRQKLEVLKGRLGRSGSTIAATDADLTDPAQRAALVPAALAWSGVLDGLVLCAGGARFTFFSRLTPDEFDSGIQLNLLANVELVRHALPHLTARSRSWIVFVNTIASREPAPPRGSAYLTAKAGLRYFADTLFAELRDSNVSVTSILPDLTATPLVTDQLDVAPESLIAPPSVARAVVYAMTNDPDACVTEIHLRPQPSLRRRSTPPQA